MPFAFAAVWWKAMSQQDYSFVPLWNYGRGFIMLNGFSAKRLTFDAEEMGTLFLFNRYFVRITAVMHICCPNI